MWQAGFLFLLGNEQAGQISGHRTHIVWCWRVLALTETDVVALGRTGGFPPFLFLLLSLLLLLPPSPFLLTPGRRQERESAGLHVPVSVKEGGSLGGQEYGSASLKEPGDGE